MVQAEKERGQEGLGVEGPLQKIARIGIEMDGHSSFHFFPLIKKPFDISSQLFQKIDLCSLGMEVFDPELFVKQDRESPLIGVDEIVRILPSWYVWVKGNAAEKITVKSVAAPPLLRVSSCEFGVCFRTSVLIYWPAGFDGTADTGFF